jgi:hypothetical protein
MREVGRMSKNVKFGANGAATVKLPVTFIAVV